MKENLKLKILIILAIAAILTLGLLWQLMADLNAFDRILYCNITIIQNETEEFLEKNKNEIRDKDVREYYLGIYYPMSSLNTVSMKNGFYKKADMTAFKRLSASMFQRTEKYGEYYDFLSEVCEELKSAQKDYNKNKVFQTLSKIEEKSGAFLKTL